MGSLSRGVCSTAVLQPLPGSISQMKLKEIKVRRMSDEQIFVMLFELKLPRHPSSDK